MEKELARNDGPILALDSISFPLKGLQRTKI